MRTSEQTNELAKALAAAQATFPDIVKNKTASVKMRAEKGGGTYQFSYADLSTIIAAVRGPLGKNELAVWQTICHEGNATVLRTRLTHSTGQWVESEWNLTSRGLPQDQGSEISYARRYTLCALLCVAADDDDDGNRGSGNSATTDERKQPQRQPAKPPIRQRATAAQLKRLRDRMDAVGIDLESEKVGGWLDKAKVEKLDDLMGDTVEALIKGMARMPLKQAAE